MNRIELDSKIFQLEPAIEKTAYIIDDLNAKYGISDIAKPNEKDQFLYAYSCGRIYNYITIANDYISESRKLIAELKEMI